jgi:hypothetical protein
LGYIAWIGLFDQYQAVELGILSTKTLTPGSWLYNNQDRASIALIVEGLLPTHPAAFAAGLILFQFFIFILLPPYFYCLSHYI